MTLAQKRQQAVEKYLRAYNAFDLEGMLAPLHPEIAFTHTSGGVTTLRLQGLEAFKQQAAAAMAFFSQRCQTIRSMVAAGTTLEVAIAYYATLAADLPNGLKAGQELSLEGKSIFGFQDDRIISIQDIS